MLAMSSRVPDDGDPIGIQRNGIHLEGYLFKKSPAGLPGMHRWQRRYFRLQDRNLLYFEKQQHSLTSTKALGVIDLANVSEIQWLSDKKNGCRFDICVSSSSGAMLLEPVTPSSASHTSHRIYALRSDDSATAVEWVTSLNACMKQMRELGLGSATSMSPSRDTKLSKAHNAMPVNPLPAQRSASGSPRLTAPLRDDPFAPVLTKVKNAPYRDAPSALTMFSSTVHRRGVSAMPVSSAAASMIPYGNTAAPSAVGSFESALEPRLPVPAIAMSTDAASGTVRRRRPQGTAGATVLQLLKREELSNRHTRTVSCDTREAFTRPDFVSPLHEAIFHIRKRRVHAPKSPQFASTHSDNTASAASVSASSPSGSSPAWRPPVPAGPPPAEVVAAADAQRGASSVPIAEALQEFPTAVTLLRFAHSHIDHIMRREVPASTPERPYSRAQLAVIAAFARSDALEHVLSRLFQRQLVTRSAASGGEHAVARASDDASQLKTANLLPVTQPVLAVLSTLVGVNGSGNGAPAGAESKALNGARGTTSNRNDSSDSDSDVDARPQAYTRPGVSAMVNKGTGDVTARGYAVVLAWLLMVRSVVVDNAVYTDLKSIELSMLQQQELSGPFARFCRRYLRGSQLTQHVEHALTYLLNTPVSNMHSYDPQHHLMLSFHTPVANPGVWRGFFSVLAGCDHLIRLNALQDVATLLLANSDNCESLRTFGAGSAVAGAYTGATANGAEGSSGPTSTPAATASTPGVALLPSSLTGPVNGNGSSNANNNSSSSGWQEWVLSLLTDMPLSRARTAFMQELFGYTLNVFALVHFDSLFEKGVEETTAELITSLETVHLFGGYTTKTQDLARLLLQSLMNKTGSSQTRFPFDYAQPCWQSILRLLQLADTFIFRTPFWTSARSTARHRVRDRWHVQRTIDPPVSAAAAAGGRGHPGANGAAAGPPATLIHIHGATSDTADDADQSALSSDSSVIVHAAGHGVTGDTDGPSVMGGSGTLKRPGRFLHLTVHAPTSSGPQAASGPNAHANRPVQLSAVSHMMAPVSARPRLMSAGGGDSDGDSPVSDLLSPDSAYVGARSHSDAPVPVSQQHGGGGSTPRVVTRGPSPAPDDVRHQTGASTDVSSRHSGAASGVNGAESMHLDVAHAAMAIPASPGADSSDDEGQFDEVEAVWHRLGRFKDALRRKAHVRERRASFDAAAAASHHSTSASVNSTAGSNGASGIGPASGSGSTSKPTSAELDQSPLASSADRFARISVESRDSSTGGGAGRAAAGASVGSFTPRRDVVSSSHTTHSTIAAVQSTPVRRRSFADPPGSQLQQVPSLSLNGAVAASGAPNLKPSPRDSPTGAPHLAIGAARKVRAITPTPSPGGSLGGAGRGANAGWGHYNPSPHQQQQQTQAKWNEVPNAYGLHWKRLPTKGITAWDSFSAAGSQPSETHTEQRVDPDVAAFMPVPTRACADLALARTALNMIKQLKLHEFKPELMPNIDLKQKAFLRAAADAYAYWTDVVKFLSSIEAHVFSDRRVEALVMRFVNCKSPKERQDVFGDLAVQAANVHKSVLASLQQRHSQLRYLQGYISSLASRTGHHSHNHPSLSVVSVAGTASSYGFGPLESSDSGPSQSLHDLTLFSNGVSRRSSVASTGTANGAGDQM